MNDKFQYDVFLSFASKDEEQAKLLWNELSSNGLRVFWSNQTLKESVGQSFFSVIQNALENSEHFLVVCTDHAMKSKWVRMEYETFFSQFYIHDKERRLIIYHDKCFDRIKIPVFLRNLQTSNDIKEVVSILGGEDIEKIKQENILLQKEVHRLRSENNKLISENYSLKRGEVNYSGKKYGDHDDEESKKDKKSILVIDDEEGVRLLLQEELELAGYNVFCAHNGYKGLDIFAEKHIDLAIVDINLPEMNGIEVLRQLKEKNNDIPVILCSAYPEYKQDLGSWAADDYVVKAANFDELLHSIKTLLKD